MKSVPSTSLLLSLTAGVTQYHATWAFQTRLSSTRRLPFAAPQKQQQPLPVRQSSSLAAVPPIPELHSLTDVDSMQMAITAANAHFMDILHSSSIHLSDAADVAVDAAGDAAATATKSGWWQTYLGFYKNSLNWVHAHIEGPMKSVGLEQTWGPSIFLFTGFVRSLLIPLSVQQSKSSEYMKALKPYQAEIREKFKDNESLRNRAIAKLYEDAGTNPLSGCLVSLLQLPIFIGLYRSITLLAKDGLLDEPFLWIPSLAGPVSPPTYRGLDWLLQGWTTDGFPTPSLGWEMTLRFLVMPVVLVLGQGLTMNVLSPPLDENASEEEKEQFESSQKVLKFLPLLIGFFSLQVPAGLTIYWLTSNGFTLAQSLAVRAYYAANPPKIELPDYWDSLDDVSKMTPEQRREAAEAGVPTGPNFDDMMDSARYHYLVERNEMRTGSPAWEKAKDLSKIPPELEVWVSGEKVITKKEPEVPVEEEKPEKEEEVVAKEEKLSDEKEHTVDEVVAEKHMVVGEAEDAAAKETDLEGSKKNKKNKRSKKKKKPAATI